MQLDFRRCFEALALLLASAACADSPTAPSINPEHSNPSEHVYYPPEDDGGCNPWTDANFCRGRSGAGDCITSNPGTYDSEQDAAGVQTCGGGGGGGGGTTEPPPPPPPAADTCLVGDEALDNPAVKQGLQDLWTRSNPDAPQAQRLEQAGWVVRRSDGSYYMAPFIVTQQDPCSINGNLKPPLGAVAFVHTHPFRAGEVMTICGAMKYPDPSAPGGFRDIVGPDGQRVYEVYDNKPSVPDRQLMNTINHFQSQYGIAPLSGLIIDHDRTTIFTESQGDGTTVLPRCGY
jgi:hypothetical protein